MMSDNLMADLLAAPLDADWTIDQLAEELLRVIAERDSEEIREFVLDAEATEDQQSRRLLRPLLACLATKSEVDSRSRSNLYGGQICFKRQGREGPVWIFGEFENTQRTVRVALRRTFLPSQNSELPLPAISSFPPMAKVDSNPR